MFRDRWDRVDGIQRGHVDAGHGGHVADDDADRVAAADCADADGGEPCRCWRWDRFRARRRTCLGRRRLLILWQSWMLGSVAVLAVLDVSSGRIAPWSLLAFTFLLNFGSAMNNPAWQAIVPELVPRELIPDAVSLSSASNNLARAVGPALGGLMVAAFKRTETGTA